MKKEHFILALVGVIALALIVSSAIYFPNQKEQDNLFYVNGVGIVYAKADIANISIGLKTEVKKNASDVIKENTKQMEEILGVIKDLGVQDKDIKTTSFQVSPHYTWIENQGQKLLGYEASQNLTVKIRDLDKIGQIISQTSEKGANQIGSIYFSFDDEEELKIEARKLAIHKAQEKARAIARDSGIKLGKIKSIYEDSYNDIISPQYEVYSKQRLMFDAVSEEVGGFGFDSMGIEAGENEIKVVVNLGYEIK